MQLHWGWAVLGALAVGAALAWWMTQHEAEGSRAPRPAKAHADGRAAAGPDTLYRWVDVHGIVNVSNAPPPPGTRYKTLHIDPNQNVVPMGATAGSPQTTADSH